MNLKNCILIFLLFISIFQVAYAAENEYGTVKAWFNGQNSTVEGIQLKIGEPVELKVEVTSKINGNVYVKIKEPGVTKAFEIISGQSKYDQYIEEYNVNAGWLKTYAWTLKPNGEWINANAPINVLVSFSKNSIQKPIQFTIANPYILDEQYTGAPTTTSAPEVTDTGAGARAAPFISVVFVICVLLLMGRRGR